MRLMVLAHTDGEEGPDQVVALDTVADRVDQPAQSGRSPPTRPVLDLDSRGQIVGDAEVD
jgi:hypothetical protein